MEEKHTLRNLVDSPNIGPIKNEINQTF